MSASTSARSEVSRPDSAAPLEKSGAPPARAFALGGWHGWVTADPGPGAGGGLAAGDGGDDGLRAAIARVTDAGQATRTLHWGRNYLYLTTLSTAAGPLPVAVKQFEAGGWRQRAKRRLAGSKAARSWHVARALLDAGLRTPEPVLLVEPDDPERASYYACRHLEDALEARYLLRAVNAGTAAETFPEADVDAFLVALGRTARRLHDAGFWHRDFSSGNVLIRWRGDGVPPDLYLLDLNRTRVGRRPTLSERSRDLARMMIHRPADQRRFLDAYWSAPGGETLPAGAERGSASAARVALYKLYHHGWRFKNEAKKAIRGKLHGITQTAKDLVLPRGTHAHIPEAPEGAATRDKVVWDELSDQPHLHAGKLEKHLARARDAGAYLAQARVTAAALPRVWRRYRQLEAARYREPVPFAGAGVALRPWPEDPEGLLSAVADLGVEHLLLRLHPWQEDHRDEEELARALTQRFPDRDLVFTLPQSRDLVRDPGRWRGAVEELAERFTPYGGTFVVGQAVNRSKWGVWNAGEYRELAATAAKVLRRHPGVRVFGPGVIDFEPLATVGMVNYPGLPRLDGLASLLYVDRRGAPEARQMGFDAADKATLLQAVADTAGHLAAEPGGGGENAPVPSWVTEVNWPLREGPHSPAGKLVAVDEEAQADYLVRYYLAVLATGHAQRVYWWRMMARGYGLICPEEGVDGRALRRRPAFRAMGHMLARLGGSLCEGPVPDLPEAVRAYRYRHPDGSSTVAAWTVNASGPTRIALPVTAAHDRDGAALPVDGLPLIGPSPLYLETRD